MPAATGTIQRTATVVALTAGCIGVVMLCMVSQAVHRALMPGYMSTYSVVIMAANYLVSGVVMAVYVPAVNTRVKALETRYAAAFVRAGVVGDQIRHYLQVLGGSHGQILFREPRPSTPDEKALAADALLALSRASPKNAAALLAANGAPAAVQLLRRERGSRNNRSIQLQQAACDMMAALALVGPAGQAAVAAAGAIPELSIVLCCCRDDGTLAAAAQAVCRLTANHPGNTAAAANKRLKCGHSLLRLLKHSSSKAVQQQAAAALVRLATHMDGAAARTHAIPVLLDCLACDCALQQRHAALALAALVEADKQPDSPLADAILRRCGVSALVALLQEGNERVVPAAALALQQLVAKSSVAAAEVEAEGGRAALLLHADSANPVVQQVASAVMRLLDRHAAPQAGTAAADSTPAAPPTPAAASTPAAPPTPTASPTCALNGCPNTRRLRYCRACMRVKYCSTACQQAHWDVHRADCKQWAQEAVKQP